MELDINMHRRLKIIQFRISFNFIVLNNSVLRKASCDYLSFVLNLKNAASGSYLFGPPVDSNLD
jgi:hypothetical protein